MENVGKCRKVGEGGIQFLPTFPTETNSNLRANFIRASTFQIP